MKTPKRFTEILMIRVTPTLKADLELKALDEDITMSSIVRRVLSKELTPRKRRTRNRPKGCTCLPIEHVPACGMSDEQ